MNTGVTRQHLPIKWAGESLTLLPERALWWPRERTLFIADPHFGKAASFRAFGIAAPEASHEDDLARLSALLNETRAERLMILGDFLHAPTGRSEATFGALAQWRARHAALDVELVLGNHDRRAGAPPAELRIRTFAEPAVIGPFLCCHEPPDDPPEFTLAGHLHPGVRLSERNGAALRGPCFHIAGKIAVLPAFGSFTGLHMIARRRDDRVFLIGPERVIELPQAT